jgi:hypothetical protein
MAVSLVDLPTLCLDKVTRILIDEVQGRRDVAAALAASLALTCKELNATAARAIYDEVVDPGCAKSDDDAVALDASLRARAAAELQYAEAHGEPTDGTLTGGRALTAAQLRAAVFRLAPAAKIPATATKALLQTTLAEAVAHRNERVRALATWLHRPERRPSACPVRPPARAIVGALRSGANVTRTAAIMTHGLKSADMIWLQSQASRRGGGRTYALSDVLSHLERRKTPRRHVAAVVLDPTDPLADWEHRRQQRMAAMRRAVRAVQMQARRRAETAAELARLAPELVLDTLFLELHRLRAANLVEVLALYLEGARFPIVVRTTRMESLRLAVAAMVRWHGRAHELQDELLRLGLRHPLPPSSTNSRLRAEETNVWDAFVSASSSSSASSAAAHIHELRFLYEHTQYPTMVSDRFVRERVTANLLGEVEFPGALLIDARVSAYARDAALCAWSATLPSLAAALTFVGLPIGLRDHLATSAARRVATGKLRAAALTVWPSMGTVRSRLSRRRLNALIDQALADHPGSDGEYEVPPGLVALASDLGAAVQRIDAWTDEVVRQHSLSDRKQRRVQHVVAAAFENDAMLLTATHDQVVEVVEAAMGMYRCPQCPESEARYTLDGIDRHMRDVHD